MATACIAATWLGIAAPIMFPKAVTVNMYRIVATINGVGSPAKRSPNPMNKIDIRMIASAVATTMNAAILPSRNSCAEMFET